jgi:hypothetical protein
MKLWQVALLICATSISTSECWINPSTYSYLFKPAVGSVSSNFQQAMNNFQISMANMGQSMSNAFGHSYSQLNQFKGSSSWRHHVWNPSILKSSSYYSDKPDQSIIFISSLTCRTTVLLYSIFLAKSTILNNLNTKPVQQTFAVNSVTSKNDCSKPGSFRTCNVNAQSISGGLFVG